MARFKYIFPDRATAEAAYKRADDRATLTAWALQDEVNNVRDGLACTSVGPYDRVAANGQPYQGETYELRLSRSHHPHGGIVAVYAYEDFRHEPNGVSFRGRRFVEVRYLSDDFASYPLAVREALGTLRATGRRLMVERHAANRASTAVRTFVSSNGGVS